MFISISAIPTSGVWSLVNGPPVPGTSDDISPFFTGSSSGGPSATYQDPLENIHPNLHDWISRGIVPSYLRTSESGVGVTIGVGLDPDWAELSEYMRIRNVFDYGIGYLVQGSVRNSRNLFRIESLDYCGVILGDQRIESQSVGDRNTPATDQYYVQDIIGNTLQYDEFGMTGDGVIIGIVDTGVDFGHNDLVDAYAVNSTGFGLSFDPGGTGIAVTSFTLPSVGGYLYTEGLDFTIFNGEYGRTYMSDSDEGIYAEDIWVGGLGGVPSTSGFYKVGIGCVEGANTQFFVFLLTDENSGPLVYDTLYIDWETSWAITADYNGITTTVTEEWDFTDESPHYWGDDGDSEVLTYDIDGDGVYDYSMGALSNTFDYFDMINGEVVSGIDAQGRGFAFMYDFAGHGTSCAGAAAGRGTVGFDVYGNGTLFTTPGVAPNASIMALKLFTYGDAMNCWFWGAGYRPNTDPFGGYGGWLTWDHVWEWGWDSTNQAAILSNSWGYIATYFGWVYTIWGTDWYSMCMDFLSVGGTEYYIDSEEDLWTPLFVVSSGNAGPGYGTSGSPSSYTAILVGASTTAHYAQPFYNNDSSLGPQPIDQIADFSSCGPTPQGLAKPDVVAPGAYAFDIAPLCGADGNGNNSWTTFGGTSASAPITAGTAALVMEALSYKGSWFGQVKNIIETGCDDLNQPAFRQGAGRINATKSVALAYSMDTSDGASDYLAMMASSHTFNTMFCLDTDGNHDPARWSRSWYYNMYVGYADDNPFYYKSGMYEYPGSYGYSGAPNMTWADDSFTVYLKPGDSEIVNVSAGTATMPIENMDAVWYELENQSSHTFTSESVYTTYPLFGTYGGIDNFDDLFQAQFMAADYAIVYVSYDQDSFMDLYDLAGQANYVFLHDWNDTNEDSTIQLHDGDNVGEVRRVMYDYSDTNVHQIHVGNPGDQWVGDQNATIYYHDVGNELYLWRDLDVTVTIKLFNRVDWDWLSFDRYEAYESIYYPWNWEVTVTVPGGTDPGLYAGFLMYGNTTVNDFYRYSPIVVRVDGDVNAPDSLTFGNRDGHPYDNGAIDGALSLSNRRASGEWRWYVVDITDLWDQDVNTDTNFTSWVMTNVTWQDPGTCIDVYIDMLGIGNSYWLAGGATSSTTTYLGGGHWDGTPTWERQNVLITDWSWGDNQSTTDWGWLLITLHVSEYGGNYIQENFTITVSPVENYTLAGFEGIPGSTAALNCSSQGDAAVTPHSTWNGPHVEFNASWDALSVPGFPTIEIRKTRVELLSTVEQEHYGTITGPVTGGWTPDLNPREAYDYVELLAGQLVYVEIEFGTWTTTEGSALIHDGADDVDVFIWAPGMAHTYGNSLTGPSTATGANPEIGEFVAPTSGEYTIGIDWYSGVVPMGWRVYVYAYQAIGVTTDGLSSEVDTAITDTNAAYDIRTRLITGTSLDANTLFSTSTVPNVTVINFFAPEVTVLNPGATVGSTEGPGLVTINWTGSDDNLDETLGYSVEVSNDSGATWSVIVYGTTQTSAVWDPTSAFYGMPATVGTTPNFLVRVNVTDGRYIASDTCDNAFILLEEGFVPPQPLELFVVIIVIIIVIIILLATCLLKRRQTK